MHGEQAEDLLEIACLVITACKEYERKEVEKVPKRWRKDEEQYVIDNWPYKSAAQIAKEMGRNPRTVQYKAWRMDLPMGRIVHHTAACSYREALPKAEWYKAVNFIRIICAYKKYGIKEVNFKEIARTMASLEREAC